MAVFCISGELPKTVILAFTVVVVVLIVTWNLTPPPHHKTRLPNRRPGKRKATDTISWSIERHPQDRRDRLPQ